MTKKFNLLCFGIILPFILSFIVYFGFGSKYADVHSRLDKLPDLYYNGLYNYRFLSRDLLTKIYEILYPYLENLRQYELFNAMNTLGTNFYILTVLYNTFFYIFFCILLYYFILKIQTIENKKYSNLLYLFIIVIVALSQYVITPFDNLSMFLFMLSIIIIFKLNKKFSYFHSIFLSIIIIISTCNRESSALILSFYAAVIFNNHISFNSIFNNKNIFKFIKHLWLPITSFILTYILIRIFIKNEGTNVVEGIYLMYNLTEIKNILGLFFYIILTFFSLSSCHNESEKHNVVNYIIFSLPYIITILLAGLLWEIRLFIPLLLGQFILANYNIPLKNVQ